MRVDGHFLVSIIKSFFRIGAASFLISGSFVPAGILFITAEVLGILEEMV